METPAVSSSALGLDHKLQLLDDVFQNVNGQLHGDRNIIGGRQMDDRAETYRVGFQPWPLRSV